MLTYSTAKGIHEEKTRALSAAGDRDGARGRTQNSRVEGSGPIAACAKWLRTLGEFANNAGRQPRPTA